MKIGLVCPYDFFRRGGVQELVLLLGNELTERGHDVRFITPRPRNYIGDPPDKTIFLGQSAKWNTPMKTTLEVGFSLELNHLEEVLETEKFDLLHVHEPEVPLLGSQIVARSPCPVVATFHATMPDTAVSRSIEIFRVPYAKSIFKNVAVMTAVSESAARFVREWSAQTVEIIPNYVNVELFSKKNAKLKPRPNTILYVGRLEKRKGVRYLLKAFHQLSVTDPKAELIIAGDGSERFKLENWVTDNNIPRVKFLGAVDEPTKIKLLHQARLFCSPAIYGESFGIVLLEAMAAGVPIVAGDNPGYACVMKDRGLLSLVNPKDTAEFARRLSLMMKDEGVRKLMLEWSNDYIKQFEFKKVINEYEKVYKRAVKSKAVRV